MLDALEEEFLIFQAMVDTDVPSKVSEESTCSTSKTYHWIDMVWNHLRKELPQLSSAALFLLTIPHNNAVKERIFAVFAKNNPKHRSSLHHSSSLNPTMLIKMNKPEHLLSGL